MRIIILIKKAAIIILPVFILYCISNFMSLQSSHKDPRPKSELDIEIEQYNKWLKELNYQPPVSQTELDECLNNLNLVNYSIPGPVSNSFRYDVCKGLFGKAAKSKVMPDYRLMLKPRKLDICVYQPSKRLLIIAMMLIRAESFEKRRLIRSLYSNNLIDYDMKILFVIGRSKNETVNNIELINEQKIHNDIVQFDFLDSYHNLTKKSMHSLGFAYKHCPNAMFVLKIHDDVVFNKDQIIKQFRLYSTDYISYKNSIFGTFEYNITAFKDDYDSKFFMPSNSFSKVCLKTSNFINLNGLFLKGVSHFLPFVLGSAFLVDIELAGNIHNVSRYIFWPPFT